MDISTIKTDNEFKKVISWLKKQERIYTKLSDEEKEKVKTYCILAEYYHRERHFPNYNPFRFVNFNPPRVYFTLVDLAERYNVSYKTIQRFRNKGYFRPTICNRVSLEEVLYFEKENPKYLKKVL